MKDDIAAARGVMPQNAITADPPAVHSGDQGTSTRVWSRAATSTF
jgi:hypothetical protein